MKNILKSHYAGWEFLECSVFWLHSSILQFIMCAVGLKWHATEMIQKFFLYLAELSKPRTEKNFTTNNTSLKIVNLMQLKAFLATLLT